MEKSTRKNIISTIITILILLAGAMIFQMLLGQKKSTVSKSYAKQERRKVSVEQFLPAKYPNNIPIDGRLKAHETVNLTSKVSGIMQAGTKDIREGRYYSKGELLFSVDSREATYNLKAQKSSLMTSITQMMPDLKFDYPKAYDQWIQYLNEMDVNKSLSPIPDTQSEQEKYFISGRNIYNQFYQIKALETRLSEYNIYAPFSGVITKVNAFPGGLINTGTTIATMINTSIYEILAPVPLDQLKYISVGQEVNLESKELEESWKGKISRIGTQIDVSTQNIPLYITVSGKGLKDGMYLRGELKGSEFEDVYRLPKNIFTSPSSIYTVIDSTIAEKEIVSIQRGSDHVLVKGLSPEDLVITGSLAGLFNGQKVNY